MGQGYKTKVSQHGFSAPTERGCEFPDISVANPSAKEKREWKQFKKDNPKRKHTLKIRVLRGGAVIKKVNQKSPQKKTMGKAYGEAHKGVSNTGERQWMDVGNG